MGTPLWNLPLTSKAEIAFSEPFECCAVCTGQVGIQRLSSGDEPGIILAHTACRATLQQRTPLCLREVYPLKDEPL